MPFDRDSGLTYTENIVRASPPACLCTTFHSTPIPLCELTTHPAPDRGTRSLTHTMERSLLENLDRLSPAAFLALPDHILARVLSFIDRHDLWSVHIWQILIQVPLSPSLAPHRHRRWRWSWGCPACLARPGYFSSNLAHASSPSAAWLTYLTIGPIVARKVGLEVLVPSIAAVRNLRVLNLQQCTFNDRIFRTWAELAQTEGAFAKLEAISAGERSAKITCGALRFLPCFKRLEVFCLAQSGLEEEEVGTPGTRVGGFVSGRGPFFAFAMPGNAARGSRPGSHWSFCLTDWIKWGRDRHHLKRGSVTNDLQMEVGVPNNCLSRSRKGGVVCFERDYTPWVPTRREMEPWMFSPGKEVDESTRRGPKRVKRAESGKAAAMADLLSGL